MLQGDVSLGACIGDLAVSNGADQLWVRSSAQNFNHDGLLGGSDGLHRLVVGGFREILAIDLQRGGAKIDKT